MPHPRKTTPKRFGKAAAEGVSAKASRDCSHGKAMVQPAPRSMARREMRGAEFFFDWDILFTFPGLRFGLLRRIGISPVQKLGAGDDGFHQRIEAILARRQLG